MNCPGQMAAKRAADLPDPQCRPALCAGKQPFGNRGFPSGPSLCYQALGGHQWLAIQDRLAASQAPRGQKRPALLLRTASFALSAKAGMKRPSSARTLTSARPASFKHSPKSGAPANRRPAARKAGRMARPLQMNLMPPVQAAVSFRQAPEAGLSRPRPAPAEPEQGRSAARRRP